MRVTLIAHTQLTPTAAPEGPPFATDEWLPLQDEDEYYYEGSAADWLAEFAGRACYQSFDRPNPATATNRAYLANILCQQHESVLEHASATFYITGVSRALTHELIRHRHLSFSQLSQRYVTDDGQAVTPPTIEQTFEEPTSIECDDGDGNGRPATVGELWAGTVDTAQLVYTELVKALEIHSQDAPPGHQLTRKQIREAVRSVLPQATETRIVVTGNLRSWRDFLWKRMSPHADREMQGLATEIRAQLELVAPNSVQDLPTSVEITQL